MRRTFLALLSFLLLGAATLSAETVSLGFANGYPPYQFQDAKGAPTGLDIEIAQALFKSAGLDLAIVQDSWDSVVDKLRLGKGVQIVGGMEINDDRKRFFDFSPPIYRRRNVIFVLATNTDIKGLKDLIGKIITGDKGSYVESLLAKSGDKDKIRIMEPETKEESMKLLQSGKVVASIMPDAVGYFLAKQLGVKVRAIDTGDPGSPVGFAVNKGSGAQTLASLEKAIAKLSSDGSLEKIKARWLE
jgi:ABC-type amino acid transport substrate-binding protein